MKLESHATPYGGTPQQRYATLHRAIEKGLASDDVWCELASVCSALGHHGEIRRCLANIRNSSRREYLERRLLGPARDRADAAGSTAATRPAAAPAASHAGPARATARTGGTDEERPGVAEHLRDAGQYLFHQQMPWLVLTTMLAFPLVVGLGGFLTAGGSILVLAAIAALPGISVLAVVMAMGHAILATSSAGEQDVPELPAFGRLLVTARDFLFDAVLTVVVYCGAPIVFAIAGAPWSALLPSIAVAALFAPLSFALRNLRRDMRPFSPLFLLRAVRRCGRGYAMVALAASASFVPAGMLAWATMAHPVWVQIAVVGPLCVLPVFASARLLGTWLDTHHASLGYLLTPEPGAANADKGRARAQRTEQSTPTRPRDLRRPRELESFRAPKLKNGRKATADHRPQPASALARRPSGRPQPRTIEGRRPTAKRPQESADTTPDLTSMPGAYVVRGEQRAEQGAASRRG